LSSIVFRKSAEHPGYQVNDCVCKKQGKTDNTTRETGRGVQYCKAGCKNASWSK